MCILQLQRYQPVRSVSTSRTLPIRYGRHRHSTCCVVRQTCRMVLPIRKCSIIMVYRVSTRFIQATDRLAVALTSTSPVSAATSLSVGQPSAVCRYDRALTSSFSPMHGRFQLWRLWWTREYRWQFMPGRFVLVFAHSDLLHVASW